MRALGTLDDYLDAVYAASRVFDEFYDFGIPHTLNANTAYTSDGSHYRAVVNDRIARVLSGADEGYGLEPGKLHRLEYRQAFHEALDTHSVAWRK
jgi:hypothetical protein